MVPGPSFYEMKTAIFHYICYAMLGVACVHGYICCSLRGLYVSEVPAGFGAFQIPE